MSNQHLGSNFDDFLAEEGLLTENYYQGNIYFRKKIKSRITQLLKVLIMR